MRSATALSFATRSASGTADHERKARRAAATAVSINWVVPSGQAATTVSSAGFSTLKVVVVGAGLPSIVRLNAVMAGLLTTGPTGNGRSRRRGGGGHQRSGRSLGTRRDPGYRSDSTGRRGC